MGASRGFRRTGQRIATHPDGYEVREALPRFAEYREADRVLRFGGEVTGRKSPYDIILYARTPSLRWEPPHAEDAISPEELQRIIERVTAGLGALGLKTLWGDLDLPREPRQQ